MRKVMNIDTVTLAALKLLAADRKATWQDLVDEALADLLKKHRRPVTTKEMFAASLKDASPKDGRRRQKP
jgi:antitoxin-like ribbon-helix-helix protein